MMKASVCCFCGEPIGVDEPRVQQVAGDEECVGAIAHPTCLLVTPHDANNWVFEEPARIQAGS